jgi:CDP-L-myo-inositol myo-inositolphosphotransferase
MAGRGERMGELAGGGSKLLLSLGGLSLIERTVAMVAREVERVVVVVGHDHERVGARASRAAPGKVQVVRADRWKLGNGASLAAAEVAVLEDPLLLVVVGDHLFSDGTLRTLIDAGGPAVLVDPDARGDILEEATRVVVADGRALAFGKDKHSHWSDCGAFVLPPEIFACQREAASVGDQGLAGAVSRLALTCHIAAVPVAQSGWWQDVDTPADLQWARRRLRRSLAKPTDGPISRRLNRPLSTRLSMLLGPLRLSPDLVSVAVFGTGLLTAVLLAGGAHLVGAVLAQATSVLDGVDGELARLQMRASPRGAMLDGVLDRCADTAIVAGLGVWALTQGLRPGPALVLTAAATAGSLLSMASKDRATALGLPRVHEWALGLLLGGRDGRLLLVAVFAVVGYPALGLIAITLTTGVTGTLRLYFVLRGG